MNPLQDKTDAARYRWLKSRLVCADFSYGDPSEACCALVFEIPEDMQVSADLDATIDEAPGHARAALTERPDAQPSEAAKRVAAYLDSRVSSRGLDKEQITAHNDNELRVSDLRAVLALAAPVVPEPLSQEPVAWISVGDRMPPAGCVVLVFYRNKYGKGRVVRAHHAPRHTIEASHWDDLTATDDTEDGCFEPEGWYEDPAVGETLAFISEKSDGKVTHWMRLPEAPMTGEPAAQSADAVDAAPWPKGRDVGRVGDMSPSASLRVGFDSDNDVFVSVWSEDSGGSVEFCNGGGGGGRSSRTRMALIALMVAMEADNAENPRLDFWAIRSQSAAAAKEPK